jgi:hypothetical protein
LSPTQSFCQTHETKNIKYDQDDGTAEESWATTITADALLAKLPNLETWDPLTIEMIRNIPGGRLISWKLCWRDPQPKWTSYDGRIIQLGDSAHAFVPSSIMGATTTLEDAMSLAECLRLAGKENAKVGTKVHELLRYVTIYPNTRSSVRLPKLTIFIICSLRRVSILQRLGLTNRREMHREGGMDATVKNAAASGPMGMGKWIWLHNAERYATENFAQARAHLETGAPFEHTNLPVGFKWEPWSIDDELEKEKQGIHTPDIKLNGDWSIY